MDLIRDAEKTYPGFRRSKKHQIPDPDPQQWYLAWVWNKISTKKIANELVTIVLFSNFFECQKSKKIRKL
jgi:hypothetical protein